MCWNVDEYRRLVIAKYGQEAMGEIEENISTLEWNLEKVLLHKSVIEKIWVFKKPVVSVKDQEFGEAFYLSMAEGESIIHSLHSIADVFSHVINILLETDKLPSHEVSFNNVLQKLRSNGVASDVVSNMDGLINCNEFKYVKAFCNTVKHYNLIDGSFHTHIDSRDAKAFVSGMRFKRFEYRGVIFHEVFLKDIYDGYAKVVKENVVSIGYSLNAYLVAHP